MSARTIVMTGATSGLGAHALAVLAGDPNSRIIVGARSSSARPSPDSAEVLPLELASLDSVRGFASAVTEALDGVPIDALVLNAGAQFSAAEPATVDGFQPTFAVNHLAHYLLARLLLPAMAEGGRVVLTTSDTHDPRLLPAGPRRMEIETWAHASGSPMSAYAASKLCNLLTAESIADLPETAERQLTVIAYNPGLTGGTGLSRRLPGPGRQLMRVLRPVLRLVSRFQPVLYMNSPEHVGSILAQLADGTVTPPAGRVYASVVRGELAYPDPSELARDPAAREELWRRSAQFTGLPVR